MRMRLPIPIYRFMVHTFDKVPYPEGINLLLMNDRQMRSVEHRGQGQIGSPPELLAQRGNNFLDGGDQQISVAVIFVNK